MYCVAQLLILTRCLSALYIPSPSVGPRPTRPLPWVGLLKYEIESSPREALAGVVMINADSVILNAREVAGIDKRRLREAGKVMFLRADNTDWHCAVKDSILHPEFDEHTLNTIALLILDCKDNIQLEHLHWPDSMTEMGDIFAVGYTDSRGVLEQTTYRMETVNFTDCLNFYSHEELDYKWLIPTHYRCYRTTYNPDQCVFDSGMALVTNSSGNITLIGISTWGPGCGLPSRFIDIERYVSWIKQHTSVFRRYNFAHPLGYKQLWRYEGGPPKDYDKYILERVNDETFAFRYHGWNKETIRGNCWKKDGELEFRDDVALNATVGGLGVYGLSMYDLHYRRITCVSVTVNCKSRSDIRFSVEKGFQQHEFFEDHTKRIPIVLWRGTIPPRISSVSEKWIKYDDIDVTTLIFRFHFEYDAKFKIEFYANRTQPVLKERVTEATETTRRTQRSHHTREPLKNWGGRGKYGRAFDNYLGQV